MTPDDEGGENVHDIFVQDASEFLNARSNKPCGQKCLDGLVVISVQSQDDTPLISQSFDGVQAQQADFIRQFPIALEQLSAFGQGQRTDIA